MNVSKDYYHILQVGREATADEIKKSFHRLALLHHPDRNQSEFSDEQFKEINEAYQCLSDSKNRSNYDLGNRWRGFYAIQPDPYIHVETAAKQVKLNEEFKITYSYIGEGRFFKKPQCSSFIFTSGPIVNHRHFVKNHLTVRETSLTYTVSAMKTGTLVFKPGTIELQHKHFASNTIAIVVQSNQCYFKTEMDAGENPMVIKLHKEQFTSNSIYRKTYIYRHTILIPRSDYAAFYHRIGSTMKVVFGVCGLCLFILKGQSAVGGLLFGSLMGGIACRLMYWMAGVHSKNFYAYRYPIVKEYIDQDYKIGNNPSNLFISDNIVHKLLMLFR